MTVESIRLALLGASGAAEPYREAAARLGRGSFVVVIDNDEGPAESMADATGAAVVLASLEDALASKEVAFDAVVVRAPLAGRAALVERAAQAGKSVFVEAPIAASLGDAERATEVARERNVCGMLGGTLRFRPVYRTLLSRLSDGKLGVPGLLRVHRWSSTEAGELKGGFLERVAGDVDLAISIFGVKPTCVHATGRDPSPSAAGLRRMPAYLQIHFGFPEGAMAVLDFATTLPAGKGYDSFHVIGSDGAAYADDHHNTHLLFEGGEPRARISSQGYLHTSWELQEFVDAILEKRPSVASLNEGCATQQVLEAVLQSLDAGQVLALEEGSYRAA